MARREAKTCACGKEATEPLPEGVDEVVEIQKYDVIDYTKLCKKCFQRVNTLKKRFKPAFYGVAYTVIYNREQDLFIIKTFSEYGDKASLTEKMKHTRSYNRSLWTGEYVVLDDDEVVDVF